MPKNQVSKPQTTPLLVSVTSESGAKPEPSPSLTSTSQSLEAAHGACKYSCQPQICIYLMVLPASSYTVHVTWPVPHIMVYYGKAEYAYGRQAVANMGKLVRNRFY